MNLILVMLLVLVILLNLWPKIVFMATHKRVRVDVKNDNGATESITLYLKDEDPVWKAIQRHRGTL